MNMKVKFSIGFKMAVAIAACLFAVISVFSHNSVKLSEKKLLGMAEDEASKVSNAVKSGLENAMLSGERDSMQAIIDSVGKENMVYDIKIIDRNAQVKYAKNHAEVETHLDRSAKSCRLCHGNGTPNHDNLTIMFTDEDGTRILRNVNPIHNKKRCHECHDPGVDILGKLLIDFTTNDIDQMVVENRKLLIFSAVATLLSSVLLCFLLASILIKQPLRKLLTNMQFAGEDVPGSQEIQGEDEIDILDKTYDSLMNTIDSRNRRIKQQMGELMALFTVSEILNKSESIYENFEMILKALSLGFNVKECSIFATNSAGDLEEKGAYGMNRNKTTLVISCLDMQRGSIEEGTTFIAKGCNELEDFLVVPLKATGKIVGVITVHSVSNTEITDTELQKSFSIIATSLAPHFQIGRDQAEKQDMQTSPFNAFISTIENKISDVRKYSGALSLVMIDIANYKKISDESGVTEASDKAQQLTVSLSENIPVIHECNRIGLDTIAILLPMHDSIETPEIINNALKKIDNGGFELTVKTATCPDNGKSALEILHSLQ